MPRKVHRATRDVFSQQPSQLAEHSVPHSLCTYAKLSANRLDCVAKNTTGSAVIRKKGTLGLLTKRRVKCFSYVAIVSRVTVPSNLCELMHLSDCGFIILESVHLRGVLGSLPIGAWWLDVCPCDKMLPDKAR